MNVAQQIEGFEGREHQAYPDPLTKGAPWTIGVGHTGPEVHEGLVWNDDQIDDALQLDVNHATQVCMDSFPWFSSLNEPRQAVLIGMAFQMGSAGLMQWMPTLMLVGQGRYAEAAQRIRNSAWAKETPRRALALADQLETGQWQ